MLKGIPTGLSGELLKALWEMGHGDELVIADANFPAAALGQRVIFLPNLGAAELLEQLLPLFPLDTFTERPICLMEVAAGDIYTPKIWERFRRILEQREPRTVSWEFLAREPFYRRAADAFCIVATGERLRYGNIILKKGIVEAPDED